MGAGVSCPSSSTSLCAVRASAGSGPCALPCVTRTVLPGVVRESKEAHCTWEVLSPYLQTCFNSFIYANELAVSPHFLSVRRCFCPPFPDQKSGVVSYVGATG